MILCLQVLIVPLIHGQKTQQERPKNVILMIGDGMGVAQVFAGMTAMKGQSNFQRFRTTGFSRTQSADNFITDSGAGATAIATGHKTGNHAIGVDSAGRAVPSLLELSEESGKATGFVVTCPVTHATPASFVAHVPDRKMNREIAQQLVESGIDVFVGGGKKHFLGNKERPDLCKALAEKGYVLPGNTDELLSTNSGKVAAIFYDDDPPRCSKGRGDLLPLASAKAIEILDHDPDGFFLMIEGSQIDWGGHERDIHYIVEEMNDFDRTIGRVLDYAEKDGNTLVIVTADHETSGLSIINGDIRKGSVTPSFACSDHTGVMVPVFAFGPGAGEFGGIYENTEIFFKILELTAIGERQ
jgi:alkaline phosphatase